jgi:hypothetical protein
MIEKLTVVATCSVHQNQKRPTYSKMWVDRLCNSVGRNLKIPFEFVCFSMKNSQISPYGFGKK